MSSQKISSYVRQNHLSLLCLFLILGGGVAYAADGPLAGQNTVGSEDIIGNEVKSDDIGNGRIFNLDIADEIITGAKLKDGTVTGADIGPNLTIGPTGNQGTTGDYHTELSKQNGFVIRRYFNSTAFPAVGMGGGSGAEQLELFNGTDLDLNLGYMELSESSQPSAPTSGRARIFMSTPDNEVSELRIIFANGDTDVIASSDVP